MNRTTREKEKRVFRMHFNGSTRDAISSELGISTGAVSEILSLLPQSLKSLRELSVDLRKNDLIIQDALLAVNIQNTLTSLGVTPEQFSTILREVIQMCETAGRKPEDVLQAANKITQLETQAAKLYPEAIEEFEQLNAENKKKKSQNEHLKKLERHQRSQIKQNEERIDQVYKEAKVAPQQIQQFKELKAKLSRSGLKISDFETLKKFLTTIEENGGDAKKVTAIVKKTVSQRRELANKERQKIAATREIENLKWEKEDLEQQVWAKRCLKNELENTITYQERKRGIVDQQIRQQWSYLQYLQAEYNKIDNIRKAAISQTGQMLGMNKQDIYALQVESDLDLVRKSLEENLKKYASRYAAGAK